MAASVSITDVGASKQGRDESSMYSKNSTISTSSKFSTKSDASKATVKSTRSKQSVASMSSSKSIKKVVCEATWLHLHRKSKRKVLTLMRLYNLFKVVCLAGH